jgi:ELWxxDGT repeat protein
VNGTLFFTAIDGVHGYELWKSNGATAGTVLVKDINPGSSSSTPEGLTNVNGTLFFSATNVVNQKLSQSLWESNGAAAGTVVSGSDLHPGSLTNVNGTLFFGGFDAVHGAEPWILGPVPASASAVPALAVPPSLLRGPVAAFPLTAGDPGLSPTTLADRHSGAVESGDSAGRERLLLEDSQGIGHHTTEAAHRGPAALATKNRSRDVVLGGDKNELADSTDLNLKSTEVL